MTRHSDPAPKSRDGSAGAPPFRAHRAITTRCRRTMTRPSLPGAPQRDVLGAGSTQTRRAGRWQHPNATRPTLAGPERDVLGPGSTQTLRARRWQYPNATRSALAGPERDALDAAVPERDARRWHPPRPSDSATSVAVRRLSHALAERGAAHARRVCNWRSPCAL
jgi:hypothetical protein